MKAIKILGGIVVFLALVAGGFWFFMLRHPSAEDVCDHVVELMAKEAGAKANEHTKSFKDQCISQMQPGYGGAIKYAKKLKCAMSAEKLADLEGCEGHRG